MIANQLKTNLSSEDISALAEIFDLLAKFDFEYTQKGIESYSSQEIKKGSSMIGGEPLLESCDEQDKK